jgi:creatinine amidohydrolase/Fe(II)-dependent formamide hydrolase-like protein/GNAT superfamily N-acetyltransferase
MDKTTWVDGQSTTVEWERLARPVAVLPLGSFEQHGPHLPVALDTIQAEHFARVTAKALGGALLPALPILQCNEHSGFRGSVGLRPETVTGLIRDIADSLERQHFKRLVIINGHGGNQSVGPVVRDINRQDRPLKIVLLDWYAFDTSAEGLALQKDSLHAAGWETAVALVLCPELVRDFSKLEPEAQDWAIRQADLNHFGIGVLRPQGYWGDPREASLEKGQAIVRSIEINLVQAVRDRLDWLEAQPAYGGAGRIIVRPLEPWDLEDGFRLARLAGWNQLIEDWRLVQALSPDGHFAACRNGALVGTTATVSYEGRVSWVAMVLVDPAMRRRGIATLMMQAALDRLASCGDVKLDATPAGRAVYLKLGFRDECELNRLAAASVPALPAPGPGIRPMTPADLPAVTALDARVFGVPRGDLLARLLAMTPGYAFVAEEARGLTGFCLGRHGAAAEYAGPVSAESEDTARQLAAAVFGKMRGRAAYIDVFASQPGWQGWLKSLGFAEQRMFTRMGKGPNAHPGKPESRFAIAGPEFG